MNCLITDLTGLNNNNSKKKKKRSEMVLLSVTENWKDSAEDSEFSVRMFYIHKIRSPNRAATAKLGWVLGLAEGGRLDPDEFECLSVVCFVNCTRVCTACEIEFFVVRKRVGLFYPFYKPRCRRSSFGKVRFT